MLFPSCPMFKLCTTTNIKYWGKLLSCITYLSSCFPVSDFQGSLSGVVVWAARWAAWAARYKTILITIYTFLNQSIIDISQYEQISLTWHVMKLFQAARQTTPKSCFWKTKIWNLRRGNNINKNKIIVLNIQSRFLMSNCCYSYSDQPEQNQFKSVEQLRPTSLLLNDWAAAAAALKTSFWFGSRAEFFIFCSAISED